MRGMNGTHTGYHTSGQYLWRKAAEMRREKKEAGKSKKSTSRETSYTATVAAEQSSVRAVWQRNKSSTYLRYGTRKRALKERDT